MDISTALSLISALGIGSFIGQYLIGSQQRRQLRSEVLHHVAETESARWVSDWPTSSEFQTSIRDLETAALIARVPRKAVMHYKLMAYTGYWLSHESFQENPDTDFAGGINPEFANLVRAAASELSRVVWSPWVGRIGLSRRIKNQLDDTARIDERTVPSTFDRACKYLRVP